MNVTRKEQRIIQRALNAWQASGELTPRTASGWRKRCASPLRLAAPEPLCLLDRAGLRADFLGSLFADSELVAWLLSLFSHSALMRILLPALLAVACYGWGFRRQRRETQWHYSTEAILFLGVVFTAVALWQLGERLDNGSGHIAPLFLAGCVIYGAIGYIARSGLVWLFFCWRWATGSARKPATSRVGRLLAGHELPDSLRPVRRRAAGALLRRAIPASPAAAVYRQQGDGPHVPVYCAVDHVDFRQLRRRQLVPGEPGATLPWGLLFAVAAGVCIFISLKTDDGMLRGFGLTFLAINLYTRFFEFSGTGCTRCCFS
jgi:hypothetical protein